MTVPLKRTIAKWEEQIYSALRTVENRRRKEAHLPPYPESVRIYLPTGKNAILQFLNWKVWSLRYCVSLEFILDVLLSYYRAQRKVRDNEKALHLGIPVSVLTGVRSRIIIEEAVVKAFPNGENYKIRSIQYAPIRESKKEESLEAMIQRYCRLMTTRQRESIRIPTYRRNFRQNNQIGIVK